MHDRRHIQIDYRKMAITAAIELMYGDDVIKRIREAESENEIDVILCTARRRIGEKDDVK